MKNYVDKQIKKYINRSFAHFKQSVYEALMIASINPFI